MMKSNIWSSVFEIHDINKILESLPIGKKIVYTYGVWDLLHPGHTRLLMRAKELGDFLIVGTVDDAPVRKLKGNLRPVQGFKDRMSNIGFLKFVDAVLYQEAYDPSAVMRRLHRVDILTKGDDWDYIPGTETIEELGGELILLSYSEDYSTSKLVNKVSNK